MPWTGCGSWAVPRLPDSCIVYFVRLQISHRAGPVQLYKLAHMQEMVCHPGRKQVSCRNRPKGGFVGRLPVERRKLAQPGKRCLSFREESIRRRLCAA